MSTENEKAAEKALADSVTGTVVEKFKESVSPAPVPKKFTLLTTTVNNSTLDKFTKLIEKHGLTRSKALRIILESFLEQETASSKKFIKIPGEELSAPTATSEVEAAESCSTPIAVVEESPAETTEEETTPVTEPVSEVEEEVAEVVNVPNPTAFPSFEAWSDILKVPNIEEESKALEAAEAVA